MLNNKLKYLPVLIVVPMSLLQRP